MRYCGPGLYIWAYVVNMENTQSKTVLLRKGFRDYTGNYNPGFFDVITEARQYFYDCQAKPGEFIAADGRRINADSVILIKPTE